MRIKRPIYLLLTVLCLTIYLVELLCPFFIIGDHYSKHKDQAIQYRLVVKTEALQRVKTIRYKARVTHYLKGNNWYSTKGDILIYFYKSDSLAYGLEYGDVITTTNRPQPISNFSDSDFDYKRYMSRKRIYDNIFIRQGYWRKIGYGEGNGLIALANEFNAKIQKRINNSSLEKKEASLAIGMLLGDKSDMDNNIRKDFNTTGLTHIICVSGLHIALILMIFDFILKLLSFGNYKLIIWRKILLVLMSFCIAFVVGLTPSSLRVAIMFSIFILSKLLLRGYDSINTLGLSAFCFLIIDPLLLFDWSFQFSFLAVFGIFSFVDYRRGIELKSNVFLRPLVSVAGMTLSAQAFVLPLLLIRVKVFPTYFLFANIVVVPFLSIILFSLLLFLAIGGELMTNVLNYELHLLLEFVSFINSLPYSSFRIFIS